MKISTKDKKKLSSLLNAFANSCIADDEKEIDYNQAYYNLMSALCEIPELKEYYDEDIAAAQIVSSITGKLTSKPFLVNDDLTIEVLDNVMKTLRLNIAEHLIVIPIQNAQFEKPIQFSNYNFIPQSFPREEKIQLLAKITRKPLSDMKEIIEHTEKSRSPDFLKYPLLCIKQKQQTRAVHYHSLNLSKIIIYAIRCFFYASIKGTSKDKTSILVSSDVRFFEKASHLAIYSKENWRQRHKPLNFDSSCPFYLGWLADKEYQSRLNKFLKEIYFKESLDKLDLSFINAMLLFNDAINQNISISTLLQMTIADSLLTNGKNEKRLRISAIIPHLVKIDGLPKSKIARVFDEFYKKRNDFVHSGQEVTVRYNHEGKSTNSLEISKKVIANAIINYPRFSKDINNQLINTNNHKELNNDARFTHWNKYVDGIFQSKIFGKSYRDDKDEF